MATLWRGQYKLDLMCFIKNIEDKVEWLEKWSVDPGGLRESKYDQNALCKILEELIKNYPQNV